MMGIPTNLKESERRQATVMFADISGFTAMSEEMDPEEVISIMNECFQMMGSIVRRYEGTIDKFIGDCIMVLFGVPVAVEDAPRRAVNTAIEMRNRLAQFNEEKHPRALLDIHIGINTGTVVAGMVGSAEKREYTVMGDAVNLASRLRDVSDKGQIYVGPLTYRYTESDFEYNVLEPISLKGKKEPVTIFELLSTRERVHRPRLGAERMVYSEMVGRDKALAELEHRVLRAINGEGFIVSVVGEAGIGKSRLIAELRERDVVKEVAFLEGRALSTGRNLSFHPIIDILKGWAGIEERDTELESVHKLEDAIRTVYPEGVTEVFPFIATLMGMKLAGEHTERVKGIEGEALEKLILLSLRKLIVEAAQLSPVVFVIEDLHWADTTSIELFESLYRLAESERILFINVFRPGYEHTGERILKTIRERYDNHHLQILLEPLDENQCEVLINNLLKTKGLPTHITELIAKRAEGNPFFIEEVARSFIDDGVVVISGGDFNVTRKIDSIVIPNTIQDLLMSRIDRLDERTRSLLKVASVIGRNFFHRILVAVADTIDEIDEKLDYLKEIQLIRERSRMAELEYLFKHALAQEATYESILLSKRRDLHIQVANAIESVFSERLREFYGMLALHYSRGEDLGKAEEYLTKAGEEALKASASNEALTYYQEALKLYLRKYGDSGDPEALASLEKNIAVALYNKGHYVEAVEHFDRVLEYWGVTRPKTKARAALALASDLVNVVGNLYFPSRGPKRIPDKRDSEIVNLTETRALALAQVDTERMFIDTIGTLRRLNGLDMAKVENGTSIYIEGSGLFSFSGVSFKISRKILDYTRDYVHQGDIKSVFFHKFYELVHDFVSGNWGKGPRYDGDLVERYLKTGDVYQAAAYAVICGLLLIEQGHFEDSKALVDRLYEIGEMYDNDYARGTKYLVNTKLLLKRRRLDDALAEAEAGISFLLGVRQHLYALCVSALKINAQFLLRDIDAMESSLMQVKELGYHDKMVAPFYTGSLLISQFLFDLSILEDTNVSYDRSMMMQFRKKAYRSGSLAVKSSIKYAANRTEAFRLMGVCQWLIGRQGRAVNWLGKSIRIGEQLGALPELARTYLEVGKRLLEKKSNLREVNGMRAEGYLEKAKALFEEMNLEWDLEELGRIMVAVD